MRILFCGTPVFAVPALRALLAAPDVKISAVVSQPDRPRGRGQQVSVPPVKEAALDAGLPVFQPEKIRSDEVASFFLAHAPDAVVIIAYGRIIPANLLEIPPNGWINLHASLLPRYRGAAPIQWAILNGETRTGLTTMRLEAGLDTGPVLEQLEFGIGPDETAPELSARLSEAGAPLVLSTLRRLENGDLLPAPQDNSLATFAPPLRKEDGRINWNLSAAQVYNRIRGLQPWPGAHTSFRGQPCHIAGRPAESAAPGPPGTLENARGDWLVACGAGSRLRLEMVQLPGRRRVTAHDFANGAHVMPGEKFE